MSAGWKPAGRKASAVRNIKKESEAALASNPNFLDTMLEGYQVLGFDWRYLYLNQAAVRQSGTSMEALLGRTMMEVYPGIEDTELFAWLETCMRERRSAERENQFVYPDGSRRWFDLRVEPLAAGISILSFDTTEARLAREERQSRQLELEREVAARSAELVRERELVESMLEGLPGILLLRDSAGRTIRSNHGLERLTGYTTAELGALRSEDLGLAAPGEELAAIRKSFEEEGRASFEASIRTKDGRIVPHYVHVIKTEHLGEPASLSIGFDISVQKRALAALELSERKTRILSEMASAANAAGTVQELLLAALRAMMALTAYPLGQVYLSERREGSAPLLLSLGMREEAIPPRFSDFRSRSEETRLATGESLAALVLSSRARTWIRASGGLSPFPEGSAAREAGLKTAVAFPVFSREEAIAVLELLSPKEEEEPELLEGLFTLVEAQIQTAMERIGAEERLRRLSAVVEQSPIAVLIAGLDGIIGYANPALSRLTGFAQEELLGHNTQIIRDRIAEQSRATEASRAAYSGQAWTGEFSSRRKDGSRYWEKVSIIPIKDGSGRLDSIVSLREDITESKLREDEIRDQEKSSRLIKAVAVAANESASVETLLGTALASVADFASWELGHVYLARGLEDGGRALFPSSIWYRQREGSFAGFEEATARTVILPGQGMVGAAYAARKPLWFRLEEEGITHLRNQEAQAEGIATGLALPLLVGESVYAVLEFYSTREILPSERLLDHLGQVGSTLRIAIARLEAEKKLKRLSEIVEQGPSGVVTLDREGLIEYVNARYAQMTGYAAGELLGRRGELLGEGLEDRELFRRIGEAMAAGRSWRGELLNARKDGAKFWERVSAFPVYDQEGHRLSFVILADDVTELKKIEEELKQATAEAERANRAKSDFLAAMSHEIRTPMNAIIGLTNLVLKAELEPRIRDYLQKIRRSSQLLLDIINDVLDFSRIEAGKVELERLPFDLEQSLQSLWTIIALRAAEKNLEIVLRLSPEVPRLLVGDPHRLGQVLLNLLGNAVKFTSRGEVVLSISLQKREGETAWLRLSVRDTGIGMSPEQLARIFKPYGQAEGGTSRKYGGSGLGLVISEQLIALMGGRMMVASEQGRGSEFSISLPFGLPSEEGALETPERLDWRRFRILVVDDNDEAREGLRDILEALSFKVQTASGREGALALLGPGTVAFDLVLLDSRLGDWSGSELLAELRALPGLESLAIVLMGYEQERESFREELRLHRASGFLAKPASPSLLLDLILGIFEGPGEASGSRILAPLVREDLKGLRVLLAEDNEINQEVARELLASQGVEVEVAEDGFAVLDKLTERDFDAVLMDLQMPRMGGLAATAHIRADPALAGNLVLAMTADVFAVNEANSRALGFDACLFKPIHEALLFDTLERLVRERRQRGIAPASRGWGVSVPAALPGRPGPPGPAIPGFDLGAGLSRLLDNPDRYRTLLFKYAENQAEAAADISRALGRREIETALALAHSLKGIAANLGAREEPALLAELEAALRAERLVEASALAERIMELHEASLAAIRSWRARLEAAASLPSATLAAVAAEEAEGSSTGACLDLDELIVRLERSDAEAEKTLGALKEDFKTPPAGLEERLARLQAQIGGYDFEDALKGAAALERELGCAAGP